ncbi:MAG TPA: hypothetical protein DIV44_03960 [Leeuwenhoekiella sp.]|uniref:hypothetical protein n=1 Tax=Leeuwenhoekiella palythoae TaxID=573501 RepID=UPI000E8CF0D2|nr:hypothetical protein [Leeuwenhoekiella palythoae]UBZ11850.1 hypothetical protein LDL79_06960 [Leeuwenhoekiella palythoae]HAX15436.1 hypothetical protein [Leeuwenhoekiella sp.]HCQ75943.1 hypothetical protein [Leeuwenhoekiella sp.]|tara:strand:- start:4492 stop:5685 length:1194 start_codon:yes stop_codon:yes gene_type:complete
MKKIILLISLISLVGSNLLFAAHRQSDSKNPLINLISTLEHNYFDITENLLNEELEANFELSRLKILLNDFHQVSEVILQSISAADQTRVLKENSSFNQIRQLTLLNLREIENKLIQLEARSTSYNLINLLKSVELANTYCEEIIRYREHINNPYFAKASLIKKVRKSKMLEERLGADGITNNQWQKIMTSGVGSQAPDLIRQINRQNQDLLIQFKKEEKAIVKTGTLEEVVTNTNVVDGLIYTYSDFPPDKLSYIYSSDSFLIQGLISWLVYINSGTKVLLSELFHSRLDEQRLLKELNLKSATTNTIHRSIKNENQDEIWLELNSSILKNKYFSEIKIDRVSIEKENIIFYSQENAILSLNNRSGNLLEQIKAQINNQRQLEYQMNSFNIQLNTY